jgi:hypothetical protein
MLKRLSEVISQSNIKGLYTASDSYRSLQYFCSNQHPQSGVQRVWSLEPTTVFDFVDFKLQPTDFLLEDNSNQ